ncbi:unnamed protein product [Debaryomyces tyrocola]|nr:unnamed protein product [Debaryomyces tyrocola]
MSELPSSSDANNQSILKVGKKTEKTEKTESDSHPVIMEEETSSTEDNTMAKTEKGTETGTSAINDADTEIKRLDEEIVNEILELKLKISTLVSNIRDTKTLCDKYDNQNQYLQDYVGSLMKSGEIK